MARKSRSIRASRRSGMPLKEGERRFVSGDVLNDTFVIRGRLGGGGMGVVYEAEDRLLGRVVALKIPRKAGTEYSVRHEAKALAALRHPSVVAVYGLWRHQDIEYLVMERIRGVTLERHLDSRGDELPFHERLDLLIAAADGLAAIHGAGIVHRDVKPANLILAPGGRMVFTDFGLFAPQFERVGDIAGSPDYMAPEIITASEKPGQGHLVDLYAFGVLAFRIIDGILPFAAESEEQVLEYHVERAPPDLAMLHPDVPAALSALVMSLLQKDPADRPEDAQAVLDELRAIRRELIEGGVKRQRRR